MPCRLLALVLLGLTAHAGEFAFAVKGPDVEFNETTRTARIQDTGAGQLLDSIVVTASCGGKQMSSNDANLRCTVTKDAGRGETVVAFADAFTLKFVAKGAEIAVSVEGKLDGTATFRARSGLAPGAMPGLLKDQADGDKGVLVTRLGPAAIPGACSLYDPFRDVGITASPRERVRWFNAKWWELHATGETGQPLVTLRFQQHCYHTGQNLPYFTPILYRPKRWLTAPVVATAWHGIQAANGRPEQTKERLFPQIDWVADHLLPYAEGGMVFQIGDGYALDDDKAMQELSDYIRSKNVAPGISFAPFAVAPKDEVVAHPTWFLKDQDDKPIPAFGGVNWAGTYTLNANNERAVSTWYTIWWRRLSGAWNFDFFSIDGQPEAIEAYRKAGNGNGMEGYREGLKYGRQVVESNKFINASSGTPVEALGLVDGSRTGGNVNDDVHAMEALIGWNFLNNVGWYCNPGTTTRLSKAPVERARLNAQARALTGQQFVADDLWTETPPDIRRVWQRSFPTLDIRPANFYRITEWRTYDLFDLRIARPWGTWDVAALFNYGDGPAEKPLDLARLPLEAQEVHVYDFWRSEYLGRFRRDAKLSIPLAGWEGRTYALVPAADGRPTLISTSRHVSQGGLDLDALDWKRDGERWTATGKSSHLVKSELYELVFAAGRYGVATATSSDCEPTVSRAAGVIRVAITPAKGNTADWQVTFEPLPENLASKAKAQASSSLDAEHDATCVNDDNPATRWCGRKDETDGAWIELAWGEPVTFDRVSIDEWAADGPRMQEWRLLAGAEETQEIAHGSAIGPGFSIALTAPVQAKRLRLVIAKAGNAPSIREIEVQRVKKGP